MNGFENGQITEEHAAPVVHEESLAETHETDMTKRMSERINEIRQKEVEPLKQKITELEAKASLGEKELREIDYLRKKDFDRTKQDVLDSLKKEFPDDNIEDIDHFDRRFYAMLHVGVDAPSAYRAVVKASQPKPLPTSGSTHGERGESGYYSEEKVRSMSAQEIKKNYDKVIASMKKW